MKIFYSLLIPAVLVFGMSMITETGSYSKYHADDVDGVLYSTNPPAEKTGAPGENNCTQCHTGTTQSAAGTITYNYSGAMNEYLPGQTYTIDLSIAAGPKNGFQMTILDGSDMAAGTFTAGTGSATTTANGREYIRHTMSTGVTSWSFDWTAPATDMGDLTVYYAFAESNQSGSTAGETIYLGQETISISSSVGMTKYEQLKHDFNAYYDYQSKEVVVNYQPIDQSKIVVNFQDLSGRLIQQIDLGQKGPGAQQEKIDVSRFNNEGIYIVSVFVDNYVLNQKIFIH